MSSTPTHDKEKSPEPSPEPSSSKEDAPVASEPESTSTTETSAEPPAQPSAEPAPAVASPTAWQAIFSPQFNAYYFYNSETQETTWINPLVPPDPTASTSAAPAASAESGTEAGAAAETSSIPHYAALQHAALAQGIDPALAHLDPSLAGPSSAEGGPLSFQAKFNARTGQFAAMDSRSPAHLSEYERAKRMSEVFFDVAAWEQNLAEQNAAEAGVEKKRKRPTKKDLERFKQQKKLKKIAKTAWLRM
ncbi:WW domain-containing protein [Mycena sanguinolenta]|uniref:WW domain-containing protein n=1 Tax=Mycena sanguinolenta TaxID=230812 RepID=A0A8H7D912_9AGAR|nr:WW domain-containing protein [Mycena sanguinolenta]